MSGKPCNLLGCRRVANIWDEDNVNEVPLRKFGSTSECDTRIPKRQQFINNECQKMIYLISHRSSTIGTAEGTWGVIQGETLWATNI